MSNKLRIPTSRRRTSKEKFVDMATNWREYQKKAASFFRSLGLDAQTDVTLQGVRTTHDIDVVVKLHQVGFDVTWIVECKLWNSKVSKLHVIALRQIVTDVGADRGIILAEGGFQSGAVEAAALTNVHIASLADVCRTASAEVYSMRLRELYDRIEKCREQYWDIPKNERIEQGLRQDVGEPGYSGAELFRLADDVFKKAFRGTYPIEPDEMSTVFLPQIQSPINSAQALFAAIELLVVELEGKLAAYAASTKRGK